MAGSHGGLGSRLGARWRRLGMAGIVLALLALMLPAFADTPQTGVDPSVTLTVSPSTGLADGQRVTVTGTGFPAAAVGTMRQCGGAGPAVQCDLATMTPFVTTAAGAIPPTAFAVKRVVNTGATTFNCGVQACAIVATAGAKSSQHQVRMAGAGTVVTTSSTTTSSVLSASTTTTTTSVPPTSTSSTSTTSISTSSTSTTSMSTTSTLAATTSSTTLAVATSGGPSTSCEALRRTQAQANADLDALVAAYPGYWNAALQAREETNARMAQALANAGC
jgi:hypothetical protein